MYRTTLHPQGKGEDIDVQVHVDTRDLTDSRSASVNTIYIERLVYNLTTLFGVAPEEVTRIRMELEDGNPQNIDFPGRRSQLIMAGFLREV